MAVVKARPLDVIPSNEEAPAKRAKAAKVLDEDDYIEAVGHIIERDFFPDLERLKVHNEYLDAVKEGDLVKLRDVSQRLARAVQTPGTTSHTPATFIETPSIRGDVVATPFGSENSRRSTDAAGQKTADVEKLTSSKDGTKVGLDTFLARNTSEDNASFGELMEVASERHRLKYSWLYDREKEGKERSEERLAITNGEVADNKGEVESRPTTVDTWTYSAKNALMYVPDGCDQSDKEKLEASKAKPQEVVHKNTRLSHVVRKDQEVSGASGVANAAAGIVRRERYDITGNEHGITESPKVGGFSFVGTPSMTPGVDASPLMTWGSIEGTPFRLDSSEFVNPDMTPGAPSFKMPQVPKREEVGLRLAEKASQQHRAKKRQALAAATANLTSPSPRSVRTVDRLSMLSPAARRLAAGSGVMRNGDRTLRAAYSPRVPSGFATPSRDIPGTPTSQRRQHISGSGKMSSCGGSTQQVTDNLLRLKPHGFS